MGLTGVVMSFIEIVNADDNFIQTVCIEFIVSWNVFPRRKYLFGKCSLFCHPSLFTLVTHAISNNEWKSWIQIEAELFNASALPFLLLWTHSDEWMNRLNNF